MKAPKLKVSVELRRSPTVVNYRGPYDGSTLSGKDAAVRKRLYRCEQHRWLMFTLVTVAGFEPTMQE